MLIDGINYTYVDRQSFPPSQSVGQKALILESPEKQIGKWSIQQFTKGLTSDQRENINEGRSFAEALRNHTNRGRRKKVNLQHRSYNLSEGKATVTFTKDEDDLLAESCRLTVVGKFSRIRPSIDKIRLEFNRVVDLKGGVKIGVYNMHHVFIDFELEKDHRNVYKREFSH
ncbi:hypothetical protein H5410_053259 [Solanum commersonii]|uniref:DUF4283 domain-containing protein n=1 Tax=Solanum commersonii TaxID=4109 RepID=A0A9J5X6K1_SOLCO|nr:hypothetical protein H5410_053259 [Solanum commersonii]